MDRKSLGADLGRIACVCLWKGFGVQATGMSGRRPQFTASVQLTSYATGIMSSAFYINLSTASRFQPFLKKTLIHMNWIFEENYK